MANYTYNVSSYSSYGSLYYSFSGDASGLNPNISANVSSGDTLTFNVSSTGHPFYIKTALSSGSSNAYNTGVTNNGTQSGTVVVTVSDSTPTTLYYQCGVHSGMNGEITLSVSTTTTTTTTPSPTTTTTTTTAAPTTTTTTTTTPAPTTTTTTTTTTTAVPTTTTTTSTTNTTPAPTTTTTTPDPSVSTTPKPEPSLTASLEVVGDNLAITFNPINFETQVVSNPGAGPSVVTKAKTTISWFLSNGSVLSSADGPYTSIFHNFLGVIIGYVYYIPLSRFAVEFAEYTFTITSSDGTDSASKVLRWTSPGTPTTTTTTTTTDSPLDVVIETNDPIECPCGEIKFPKGGHYYPRDKSMPDTSTDFVDIDPAFGTQNTLYGLRVLVKEGSTSKDYGLIHSDVIYLKSEDKFVTVTNTIEDHITPDKLGLYIDLDGFYRMNLENVITVTVQDELNKKTLGHKSFGAFGSRQKIARSSLIDKPSLVLNLTGTTNLYKNSLIITVQSNCHYDRKPCCDRLPQIMRVTNSGDALYGKVGSGICIPLDSFYTGEEINYQTTTTPHPDTVTFVKDLSVTTGASEATLSAQIKSYYGSDIKYWWELINTDCLTKLTTLQTAKSNEEISFTDTRAGSASYRIRVVSPEIKFSNTVSVTIPTTTTSTTTPAPTTTTTTTTTTADPSTQVSFRIYQQGVVYPRHWDSEFNRLITGNGLAESLGHSSMDDLIDPSSGSGDYGERWFAKSEDLDNPEKTNNIRYSAPFSDVMYHSEIEMQVRTDTPWYRLTMSNNLNVVASVKNPVGPTTYIWYFVDLMAEGGVYIPTPESLENLNWQRIPNNSELRSDSFDENGHYINYPHIQLMNTGSAEQRLAMAARTSNDRATHGWLKDENRWLDPATSIYIASSRSIRAFNPSFSETHGYIELPDIYRYTSFDRMFGTKYVNNYPNAGDLLPFGLTEEQLYDRLGTATQAELYPFLRRFLMRCVATNNGVSATSQTFMISNNPLFVNYGWDNKDGVWLNSLCEFSPELNTIEPTTRPAQHPCF